MNLTEQRQLVADFMLKSLETWSTAGFDSERGTFIEALDFDANPLPDLNRRGRVQGRQVYVYALAHNWGLDPSGEYLSLAEKAWASAKQVYLTEQGGWIFSATYDGKPVDTTCFVYERAFTIMALSALHQATGKSEYETEAKAGLDWIVKECSSPNGGFNLGVPFDPAQPREQNPHMHLFEACMDCGDIAGDVFRKQADVLFSLAIEHFISPSGALIEFFTQDWKPDPKTGADLQPGHLMEWTWLLTQYAKVSGRSIPQIELLYKGGCNWGLDKHGLGVDEIREGGEVLRGTKRIWVECEVLKAHLARYESTNETTYLERAQNVLKRIFELYLKIDTGIWFDQMDENDKNISKNAPASTLYHLFLALHEFMRVTPPSLASPNPPPR